MASDLTLPADNGFLNLRVGAIIKKEGKVLMVRNPAVNYCYSVGGRVRFGETLEQAVLREVLEETGVPLPIDRLGFVHEAFFYGESEKTAEKVIQELSFYFYMKTPEDFSPVCGSLSGEGQQETLIWLDPAGDTPYFPAFFRTELKVPSPLVKHIVTDERDETNKSRSPDFRIIHFEEQYRDDMIFMVLEAKDTLGRVPRINDDLLDIEGCYLKKGGGFWLAMDENDRVIGCIGCNLLTGDEAVLHRLYVKCSQKRQGIGSALLETAEDFARSKGRKTVKVHLGDKNIYFESRAFYPKRGYRFVDDDHAEKRL